MLEDYAQAAIDGLASTEQLAVLEVDTDAWASALWRLLDAADAKLERTRKTFRGPARATVLADLDDDCFRIDDALTALVGPAKEEELQPLPRNRKQAPPEKTGTPQLQLSWNDGQLVAWVSGHDARYEQEPVIREYLEAAGGGNIDWQTRGTLRVPTSQRVPAVATPMANALGWLVAQARRNYDPRFAPSIRWMGLAAATAVSAVAQGRMAPQMRQSRRGTKQKGMSNYSVRWLPGLINADVLKQLTDTVPGSAMVGQQRQEPLAFTTAVMGDVTNTIVRMAAAQVELPAPPPEVKDRQDVSESFLGRLDGTPFQAPDSSAAEIARRIDRWSAPVVGTKNPTLTVQLAAPDESNAWLASGMGPFLQITFHSCTLLPGSTPFVRNQHDRSDFLGAIDQLLGHLSSLGCRFETLREASTSLHLASS